MGIVNRVLTRFFYSFGECIGKSPKYFIITPILLTFVFTAGFFRISYLNNPYDLYTKTDGISHYEKNILENLFPSNYSQRFDPSRLSKNGRFVRLIITAKNEDLSVLTSKAWEEILILDSLIHKVTIDWNGEKYNYSTLCASWFGNCFENEFLDLTDEVENLEKGTSKLNYPLTFNPKTYRSHLLPQYFGGIRLKEDNFTVEGATAISLTYVAAVDSQEDEERGMVWERAVMDSIHGYDSRWDAIKVRGMGFVSWADEMDRNVFSVAPSFVVTSFLMSIFTIATSMMTDWVKSKPWLGLAGSVSALLGTIAGAGIVSCLGVPFMGLNLAIPFLMLGIGIDDTFVMLAAWRRTSPEDPVPKRMAECYSDAAVSVTITTLTDMTSFYIGALTSFPSIQIFSYYAGTCILCIYIYQLCLFGGAMAVSGYHEAKNRHSVFWWIEAVPKSKAGNLSKFKRLLLIGGVDKSNLTNPEDSSENLMMVFFRDSFSNFIFHPAVKILVLIVSMAYIAVAAWGITQMDIGFRFERAVSFDSFVGDYVLAEQKYFRQYPHRIQILVNTPLDYSTKETQGKIKDLMNKFYNIEQVTDKYAENWLRDFTTYVENYKDFVEYNITTEQGFIDTLLNEYLNEKSPISRDIVFNENKTKIIATRYIIQSQNIYGPVNEKNLVLRLRDVCKEAEKEGLNVTMYHPWFHFDDQLIAIGDIAIRLVGVAAVIVMFVAILFIPNLVCSISVLFSIVSIEIGIMGYMSLWGVSLDLVSIMCIIMCIGFSVDFSAHISYSFISSKADSTEDKMREALFSLGLPVLQGAISTIIGIAALLFAQSYNFQVFFKITVLVIGFAVWHALFLLPVLLLLLKPDKGFCSKPKTNFTGNSTEMKGHVNPIVTISSNDL